MSAQETFHHQLIQKIIQYDGQLEFSSVLHPSNAEEQCEQFLRGDIENPQFTYARYTPLACAFPLFDIVSDLDAFYSNRIAHTVAQAALLAAVGDDAAFTLQSRAAFPLQKIALPPLVLPTVENATLGTDAILAVFQEELHHRHLSDWTVVILPHISSRMFVNQSTKTVGIRAGLQVSEAELQGLIRHEVGVHVLRSANGSRQHEPLLHVGTKKGRLFEEGVACYQEDPQGPSRIFLRHHTVTFAQTHSFRDTWEELRSIGLAEDDAWSMTLRVKRGLTDASKPGGFTRDALYAQAFLEMREYMQAGGEIAPLLSAPIHPSEISFFVDTVGMDVFRNDT